MRIYSYATSKPEAFSERLQSMEFQRLRKYKRSDYSLLSYMGTLLTFSES